MIDRIFFAAFTFCLMMAATMVLASAMLGISQPAAKTVVAEAIAAAPVAQLR